MKLFPNTPVPLWLVKFVVVWSFKCTSSLCSWHRFSKRTSDWPLTMSIWIWYYDVITYQVQQQVLSTACFSWRLAATQLPLTVYPSNSKHCQIPKFLFNVRP